MIPKTFLTNSLLLLLLACCFLPAQSQDTTFCGSCYVAIEDFSLTRRAEPWGSQCGYAIEVVTQNGGSCNGNSIFYSWDFGDGTTLDSIAGNSGSNVLHSFPGPGTYTICITFGVNRPEGPCTVSKCFTVGVQSCSNLCGSCNASVPSPEVYYLNTPYGFVAQGSTSSGCEIIGYSWDFGDGGSVQTTEGVAYYIYSNPGVYTVVNTMHYVSELGDTCSTSNMVEVNTGDQCNSCGLGLSPIDLFAFSDCEKQFSVPLTLSASNCPIVDYTWDFGDGTTASSGPASVITHTYTQSGLYPVTVTVVALDPQGDSCTISNIRLTQVTGCVPSGCTTCGSVVAPITTVADEDRLWIFAGNFDLDTPRCTLVDYVWDFGDGTTATTPFEFANHQYSQDGNYTVCVTMHTVSSDGTPCSYTSCEDIAVCAACYEELCEKCYLDFDPIAVNQEGECKWNVTVSDLIYNPFRCTLTGYEFNWGDGTMDAGNSGSQSHVFDSPGTYEVCVTAHAVTNSGETCSRTRCETVVVTNYCNGPSCSICMLDLTNPFVSSGLGCEKVLSIDPVINNSNCTMLGFDWDMGDGSVYTNGPNFIKHSYQSSGSYQACVTMKAINAQGDTCGVNYCMDVIVSGCNACFFDAREPNNSAGQASNGGNMPFSWGALCIGPGDADWISVFGGTYYIQVTGAASNTSGQYRLDFTPDYFTPCVTIETRSYNSSSTDTYLRVFDSNLNLLLEDDNSGSGLFSKIRLNCGVIADDGGKKKGWTNEEVQAYPNPVAVGHKLNIQLPENVETVELLDVLGRVVARQKTGVPGKVALSIPLDLTEGVYTLRSPDAPMKPIKIKVAAQH